MSRDPRISSSVAGLQIPPATGISVFDHGDGDAELRNTLHKFARAVERIDDPDALFVETSEVVDGFFRQPALAVAKKSLAQNVVDGAIGGGDGIVANFKFGLNGAGSKAVAARYAPLPARHECVRAFLRMSIEVNLCSVMKYPVPSHPRFPVTQSPDWVLATGSMFHAHSILAPVISKTVHKIRRSQSDGNARGQMRAEHSAGNRADQQGADQMPVDIACPPVQQAGDAGQNYGMGNIGADHDFGSERIKQEQQHHDDAARPDRGDAHQKSADQSNDTHEGERLHGGLAIGEMLFNPPLKHQQGGDQYQQQSYSGLDEVVDARCHR